MKPNQFAMKLFNIGTQNYTDHVIVSNDGDFYNPYNDGLKTDKSSASTLLDGSVKSDRILKRFENTENKWIDTGISFITYFNVDESLRIRMSPSVKNSTGREWYGSTFNYDVDKKRG